MWVVPGPSPVRSAGVRPDESAPGQPRSRRLSARTSYKRFDMLIDSRTNCSAWTTRLRCERRSKDRTSHSWLRTRPRETSRDPACSSSPRASPTWPSPLISNSTPARMPDFSTTPLGTGAKIVRKRGRLCVGGGADGDPETISSLPPPDVKIGTQVPGVAFMTLAHPVKDPRRMEFDGLLSIDLFRRVFVDYAIAPLSRTAIDRMERFSMQ